MKHPRHRFRRSQGAANIDGIISSSGRLGERPLRPYRPSRGAQTPSLGDYVYRSDGFHPADQTQGVLGEPLRRGHVDKAEAEESQRLPDESIVIDDDFVDSGKKKAGRSRFRRVLKRSLITIGLILILVGAFLGLKVNHDIAKVFHGNIFSILHSTKLKGEDQGRVTILLAGNSADDPGHSGGELTDSIMLLSIDTVHNTGYIMSIPRDLYVNYGTTSCQFGNSGKINAVYECGQMLNFQQSGFPNGGMGQLEKVVDNVFAVNIDYYALVDYSALREGVDAVGGVNFSVNSTDYCPILHGYGLYDDNRDYSTHGPLVKLANGSHLLNGQQALDLSRARGDPPYSSCGYERGDFTRTQNQRQLLLNLKSKVLSLGTLSNPVKINSLLNVLGNNVQTDFHVDEIKRLYDLGKNIPNNNIQSIGLADSNVNLVRTGAVGDQSVVIPTAGVGNYSKIQAYLRRVGSNDPIVKEAASVVVLNGSETNGLAAKTATGLTDRGLDVLSTGDATSRAKTVIVSNTNSKPATLSYLQKKFNVTTASTATAYPEAKYYSADFVIILGEDAASSQ